MPTLLYSQQPSDQYIIITPVQIHNCRNDDQIRNNLQKIHPIADLYSSLSFRVENDKSIKLCSAQTSPDLIIKMLPIKINIKSPHRPTPLPTLTSAPKPDIFISIHDQLLAGHRRKLSQIRQVSSLPPSKHILMLTEQLGSGDAGVRIQLVQQIVGFYYGHNIEIADCNALGGMLEILGLLGVEAIVDSIQEAFIAKIKEVDTFTLLGLAHEHGLDSLLKACFGYLEAEEFEQCRYYQYSFLECEFRLFQVVLRHHHHMKMEKSIEGLPVDVVEQVLVSYCRRNGYRRDVLDRLVAKYVLPWRYLEEQKQSPRQAKGSLRLHKLPHKNIGLGQSTTIYGNDSEKRSKQSQFSMTPTSMTGNTANTFNFIHHEHRKISQEKARPQSNPTCTTPRMRKYSMELEKMLGEMGFQANFLRKNIRSSVDMACQPVIPEEDQHTFEQLIYNQQFSQENGNFKFKKVLSAEKDTERMDQIFEDQISQIGNKGSTQLKTHEIDMHPQRPNTKSMIFAEVIEQEVEQSMEQKSRKNAKNMKKIARLSLENQPFPF